MIGQAATAAAESGRARVTADTEAPHSQDTDGFAALVRDHSPALRGYCRRLVDDETAGEIVQETFITAWRSLTTFRGDSSIRTWLFAICTRKLLDSRRRRRPAALPVEILEVLPDHRSPEPSEAAANTAFMDELDRALHRLPVRQRASWVMRELEARTFPEIGRALGLSPDAARGQYRRAAAALAEQLETWR